MGFQYSDQAAFHSLYIVYHTTMRHKKWEKGLKTLKNKEIKKLKLHDMTQTLKGKWRN